MTVILRCNDPRGQEIIVTQEQWDDHIIDHAEMIGQLRGVELALTDPTFICEDRDFDTRENYYRPFTLPGRFHNTYLKVCVEFPRPGLLRQLTGEVVTAFSTANIKQGETQTWP